jgi:alpha-beta hydrolase superfamily lysophospholipase
MTSDYLPSGIFYRSWPCDDAKALILISHGLGEHSGRYDQTAADFNAAGFSVVALDHIGHGQSPGRRAYAESFAALNGPLTELRTHLKSIHPELPVFLIGHSMGGLIAASSLITHQGDYCGAILTGPALGLPAPPPLWQVLLLRALSWLVPTAKAFDIDSSAISRDAAVVEAYLADDLVHHQNIPARTVVALFDEGGRVLQEAKGITLPLLLLHGAEDKLTSVEASKTFVEQLGSSDKQITVYDGLFHELFNEPERDDIISTCITWINARL